MIFNLEKPVLKSVFESHPSKLYDDTNVIAEIVDNLCEYNTPNTPLMQRICNILEENYYIWEREDFVAWFMNDASIQFHRAEIKIYIMTINDDDADDAELEMEEYFDREIETLKRRGYEIFVLNSDFDYYDLYYFSKDIEKEAIATLELMEIMAGTFSPFDLQRL